MSSDIAIKVEDLNKCYHIYDRPRDRLMQMLMRGRRKYYREFWATKNVSFEIKKGETVGIVGKNGSGKSTLLQMICGTLNQTSGQITTNGRIAALLELGSGFNPEFTGSENVYLNAAILGLSRDEIDARYESILEFADIGSFIDQPVKNYSSGMLVRLAFSVAINVDPEILIIDEALSVGDELFQRKCFARIEKIKSQGSTILFVSHAGGTIVELCDRAILIDSGELLTSGIPKSVVSQYQKLLYAPNEKHQAIREEIKSQLKSSVEKVTEPSTPLEPQNNDIESFDPNLIPSTTLEYESHGAYIHSPLLFNLQGKPVNNLLRRNRYRYTYKVNFAARATNVRFGMVIKTKSGLSIGGALSASADKVIPLVEAGSVISVSFAFDCLLNPGTYFMNAGVFGTVQKDETVLHRLVDAIAFRVPATEHNLATEIIDFGCMASIELHE